MLTIVLHRPSHLWLKSSIDLFYCHWGWIIRLIESIHNICILLVSLPAFVACNSTMHAHRATDNIPNTSAVKSTQAIDYSTLHHHWIKRELERGI